MRTVHQIQSDAGVKINHGSACWMVRVLESMDSVRCVEMRAGVLSADRLNDGVDVDEFVSGMWQAIGMQGYLELNLMMTGGQVVSIEAVNDGRGSQVLGVRFDESRFPAGLTGRWVDHLTGRVRRGRHQKAKAA